MKSSTLISISNPISDSEYCRILSFIPDDNIHQCGAHHEKGIDSPSLIELEFLKKKHRNPKVNKLTADFFKSVEERILYYQNDVFRLFKLPSIDKIEHAIATGEEPEKPDKFKINTKQLASYKRIVQDLAFDLIGTRDLTIKQEKKDFANILSKQNNNLDDMPIYQFFMNAAGALGIEIALKMIKKRFLNFFTIDEFNVLAAALMTGNDYLLNMILVGANRIKTELALRYFKEVRRALIEMARNGQSVYDAGRFLYKNYGGRLWYWLRISRSEIVLVLNEAYKKAGKKMKVKYTKWSAAATACNICAALDGHVWKFDSHPYPVSDTHPHCVINSTKIMTYRGWRRIDNIDIGDYVLTHKGRFRKVIKLHKHKEKNQKVVYLEYKNNSYYGKGKSWTVKLKITDNHPVFVNGQWIDAGKVKVGDKIKILATRCEVCSKLIPYSRWRNNKGEKSRFCSLDCFQKVMDRWTDKPKKETVHIRNKISNYMRNNNPMFNTNSIKKLSNTMKKLWLDNNYRNKVLIAKKNFYKENPEFMKRVMENWKSENPDKDKKRRKKQSKSLKKFFKENPDKRLNVILAKRKTSKGQLKLFELMKQYFNNVEYNKFIKTSQSKRWGDVVLNDHNIIIEYDHPYWHQDKEYELKRDLELKDAGYYVIHVTPDNWEKAPEIVNQIIKNHNHEFEFIDIEITNVIHKIEKSITLYNLSVDEDESYIAKGFVVHNCYCILVPLYKTKQDLSPRWQREHSPYDVPYSGADEIEQLLGITPVE